MDKAYISGKISGMEPEDYTAKFAKASRLAETMGYEPVNPVELQHEHDNSWQSFMRVDLKALLDCNHILMLPNWKDSKGATIEHDLAKSIGLNIIYLTDEN